MKAKRTIGHRAQRSGHWSETKWTNLNHFDPRLCELGRVEKAHYGESEAEKEITIRQQPLHPAFMMPVSESDIRDELSRVPARFLTGLKAIFLLGGSKRQEKTFRSLFAYGCYDSSRIALHPYPRKCLSLSWRTLPKPSDLLEYERAGAVIQRIDGGWTLNFDHKSLRNFYLRDVLLHELGHHVDRRNFSTKSDRKAEGFASWFVTTYGYSLRQGPTLI